MKTKKRYLVIGIGSPVISDDAIGIRVAERILEMNLPDVDVDDTSISGLDR
jgi:hydrogenase maturation protease